MKSGKQRRAELDANRKAKQEKAAAIKRAAARAALEREVCVNAAALAPTGSYGWPEFVDRGYYVDEPFTCVDCGKFEVWKASQQKWWYEVAKGDMFTKASRCRACRRVERKRRNEARRVHLEGLARKRAQANA